jgi:hypothetical protein
MISILVTFLVLVHSYNVTMVHKIPGTFGGKSQKFLNLGVSDYKSDFNYFLFGYQRHF